MNYFLGQIGIFGFNFAPVQWAFCNNALLPIAQNTALFSLLGTNYGGDGQTNFAVPDLRGRIPIHQGTGPTLSNYAIGQTGGSETVALTSDQMAAHFHLVAASTAAGTSISPAGNVPATVANQPFYAAMDTAPTAYALPANTIGTAGSNAGHDNMGPTLAINYCIATAGIFPQAQN